VTAAAFNDGCGLLVALALGLGALCATVRGVGVRVGALRRKDVAVAVGAIGLKPRIEVPDDEVVTSGANGVRDPV
jgi:hypothetical protein